MTLLLDALRLVHVLGFALLLGGLLAQWRASEHEVTAGIFVGALVQFVSGVGLVAASGLDPDGPPDHVKVGVKAAISVVLLVLTWANRRWRSIPQGVWWILVALAVGAAAVGVAWH